MDQPPIPFDLARMFLGDAPPLFFLEILVRTLLIYGYTIVLIRWIGGRGVAQLSMVELLLVITLGSAVGDVTFYPDVPLLHAMAVITIVGHQIEAGRLPPDVLAWLDLPAPGPTCALRDVADRLERFVHSLEPHADPAAYNAIVAVLLAFVNPSAVAQACA